MVPGFTVMSALVGICSAFVRGLTATAPRLLGLLTYYGWREYGGIMREYGPLGQVIRDRRKDKGLSQLQLAAAAGIGLGVVRDLEQGITARPRTTSVLRLLAVLDLDITQVRTTGSSAVISVAGSEPTADPVPGSFQVLMLGPLEVWRGPMPVGLGSPRQQALLSMLALRANQVVGREALLETLWENEPPPTAVTMIQSAVSRLRRALAPARADDDNSPVIVLTGTGYRLQVRPEALDTAVFAQACAKARSLTHDRDLKGAYTGYEHALGLWRDEPLAGLKAMRSHPLIPILLRERATAIVEHAALASELGQHDRAIRNLRTLAADEPLDERAHARLMISLAGAGQQAAALDVFEQMRCRLADQLGVSPSAELREAHERVLRQQVPTYAFKSPRSINSRSGTGITVCR